MEQEGIATVEDIFLKDLPTGVTLMPKDWEGETTRVHLKFAVSKQAVNNKNFDLQRFIKAKFDNSLKAIRARRGIEELRLKRWLSVTIDPVSSHNRTFMSIYIEFAKVTDAIRMLNDSTNEKNDYVTNK